MGGGPREGFAPLGRVIGMAMEGGAESDGGMIIEAGAGAEAEAEAEEEEEAEG